MVYQISVAETAPEKEQEAREWAKEHQDYAEKKYGIKGHMTIVVTPWVKEPGSHPPQSLS